jgi:hypothetical protein
MSTHRQAGAAPRRGPILLGSPDDSSSDEDVPTPRRAKIPDPEDDTTHDDIPLVRPPVPKFPWSKSSVSNSSVANSSASNSSEQMDGVDFVSGAAAQPEPEPAPVPAPVAPATDYGPPRYFPAAPPLLWLPRKGRPIISEAMERKFYYENTGHTLLVGVSLPPSPSAAASHHVMWQWCQANTGWVHFKSAPAFNATGATIKGYRVRMTVDVFVETLADAQALRAKADAREPVWLSRFG